MKRVTLLVVLAALLGGVTSGCGPRRAPTFPPPPVGPPSPTAAPVFERGLASWYGPGFHGNQTANGEIFDTEALTAAHKTLPFDTRVQVTNVDNGRTVVVRINDRGPFVRGRIIDLSRAAARELDLIGPGLARVELRILDAAPPRTETFTVQVGAFAERRRAEALALRLEGLYGATSLTLDGDLHRVRVGVFDSREQAQQTARQLRRDGYEAVVVRR